MKHTSDIQTFNSIKLIADRLLPGSKVLSFQKPTEANNYIVLDPTVWVNPDDESDDDNASDEIVVIHLHYREKAWVFIHTEDEFSKAYLEPINLKPGKEPKPNWLTDTEDFVETFLEFLLDLKKAED